MNKYITYRQNNDHYVFHQEKEAQWIYLELSLISVRAISVSKQMQPAKQQRYVVKNQRNKNLIVFPKLKQGLKTVVRKSSRTVRLR